MHHFSLLTSRPRTAWLAAVCSVLLTISSLTLPQRSAGQDPQNGPPMSSSGSAPSDYPSAADNSGSYSSGNGSSNDSSSDSNLSDNNPSDSNSVGSASSGSNSSGDGSVPNPQVGVDTNGHAVATRNGRTTRPRRPVSPANPLVLTDPTRSPDVPSDYTQNNSSANAPYSYYLPYSDTYPGAMQDAYPTNYQYNFQAPPPPRTENRLIPPVVTRDPQNYTVQTDPSSLPSRGYSKPLPLFGYDFFQPARQIIIARRRALLPAVPRINRYSTSRVSPGQRANPSSTGYGNTGYGNGGNVTSQSNANAGYGPGGGPANGYGIAGDDGMGSDTALLGAGAALGASGQSGRSDLSQAGGVYGNDRNGSGSNQPVGPNQNDGQYPSSNASQNSNGYPDSGGNRGYVPAGSADEGSAESNNGQSDNGDLLNGDVTSTTELRRRSQSSGSQNYLGPNGTEYSGSGDGFPEDANAPLGSDIQFPGDDALVQGSANAVTGQIADPISTLYKNVLASLPSNYQLQPGDALTVRYSALTLAPREFTTTVDLQGGIDVEGVGRISVAGRTASQAEDTLRLRLERLYRNVDVSINLRQLRTIQVTVSGAAFAPGTYTVPATATAFNVLNAAGGPTADGSLRDIRVLRGGRPAGILDIYPLIGAVSASPSGKNGDIALQAGDNIYIPARLSRIAIRGEVRQQAIYELTARETLSDALRYAGGVKPSGVDQIVHIDTINNGTDRVIRDVSLRDKTQVAHVSVYDGDTIEVSSIRSIITNRVTISGAVDQPGDYALTPGLTVAALIARARGPLYDAYLDQADLIRLNPDNTTTRQHLSIARALDGDASQNIPLKRFDILRLYTRQEVAYLGRRLVTVRGAVQRPGLYTESDNMRISDLLLDSGGPLPDAYLNRAVLLHQNGDGTYAYSYISLREVLTGDADADLPVQDNDVLAVYRIGEAHFTPDHTVKVLGNVLAPGLYARGEDMRLSDLLKLAGAFKPGGGTRVTVAHARRPINDKILQVAPETVAYSSDQTVAAGTDLTLQDGDVVAVQGDGSLRDHPAVVTVTGLVNRPGPIIIQQGMHLSDAIREAGGLRPEAFPQGAEFTRTSDALVTSSQLDLAAVINRMSDMLNLSQYQRERAKANLALIEAAGSAASGSTSSSLIPGLGGASAGNASNPNLAPLIATLPQNNPVSPGRLLTPSQLRPNGAVAVQLAQALKHPGGTEDVLLKDGDTLVVPETPTTVQVVGAVFSSRGVVYRPGQSIDYYIQRAGDFTPDAARDRIEVIHAGGGLIPADKAGALQPGDLILVPTKVLAEKIGRSGNGFSDFFQGLLGGAITLKVLSSVFGL